MPSFESYPFAEVPPSEQAPSEPQQNPYRPDAPDLRPPLEIPELRDLVEMEADALKRVFGYDIEVPPLPRSVTPERMEIWREKGMDLHYLPPEDLREERDLPGWKRTRSHLPGYWILIERREKQSRLGFSWEDLHLPGAKEMIARQLDVPPESVRQARAIELSYLANAFNEEEWHRESCRPPLVVVFSPSAESAN